MKRVISILTVMLVWSTFSFAQTNKSENKPINSVTKNRVAALHGTMSKHTDMEAWFSSMKSWGVQRYYLFSPHYRGYQYSIDAPAQLSYSISDFTSLPLISDLNPDYNPYIDRRDVVLQEDIISGVREKCMKNNIELGYMIPFPVFPVNTFDVVKKVQPELFRKDGTLDIHNPAINEYLKNQVRHIKNKLPELKSFCYWLAEGCGSFYKFTDHDLEHVEQWMPPMMKAFNEVCEELDIEGVIFSHDYFHTVESRRKAYEAIAAYPKLVLMEDITWPEENTMMPFWGHVTDTDKKILSKNPIMTNFLVDTEYLGQGDWPGVFPRWWKQNVEGSYSSGVRIIGGRTFFWDNAKTDQNFNRLNAHLLILFARNPELDPKEALTIAAKEAFGEKIPKRLIEILWETEPMIQNFMAINRISILNHSRFAMPFYLDHDYFLWRYNMWAVDDLFQPVGTKLYPELNDSLNAGDYWRFQRKSVAGTYDDYMQKKLDAIAWFEKVIPEVEKLSKKLSPEQARLFNSGYNQIYLLARGMKCFLEAAKVHYDWYRAKTIDKNEALRLMKPIAEQLREIASEDPGYPLGYGHDMRKMADEIETLQITKGKW